MAVLRAETEPSTSAVPGTPTGTLASDETLGTPGRQGHTASLPAALAQGIGRGALAGLVAGGVAAAIELTLHLRAAKQYIAPQPGHGRTSANTVSQFVLAVSALDVGSGILIGAVCGLVLTLFCRATQNRTGADAIDRAARRTGLAVTILLGLLLLGQATTMLVVYCIAQFRRGVLIAQLVGVLVPVFVVVLALLLVPLQRGLERLLRRRKALPSAAMLAAIIFAVALLTLGGLAWRNADALKQLHAPWIPIAVAYGATLIAVGALLRWRDRRTKAKRSTAKLAIALGALAFPLVCLLSASPLVAERSVSKALTSHAPSAGAIAKTLAKLSDGDGDGYAKRFGGGDCDDTNPDIYPGAFDAPDNGLDENCTGEDATLGTSGPNRPRAHAQPPPEVGKDLNLILITVDTLRADHVGTYGYGRKTSPRIDELGKRGIVFENAYAHAPSTRYSMPVILTGQYASRLIWDSACPFTGGCPTRWPPPLSLSNRLLPELLAPAGYFSAALLNYRFFNPGGGYDQGFALYDNGRAHLHQGPTDPATHGSSSAEQADAAIAFLKAHSKEKFFVWVHFYDPHYYYEDHPDTGSLGPSEIDRYDSEIAFTDHHIGRVLDALAPLGLDGRTAIALTSDHGEGFGEHGIAHHGYQLYDPQTRVPLMIAAPGLPPGRAQTPVGHVDLFASLLALLRQPIPPELPGRSVLDLPASPDHDHAVFLEVMYEGPVTRKAVVMGHHKLIWNMVPDGTFELYDLAADRGETADLAESDAAKPLLSSMKRRLEGFVSQGAGAVQKRVP